MIATGLRTRIHFKQQQQQKKLYVMAENQIASELEYQLVGIDCVDIATQSIVIESQINGRVISHINGDIHTDVKWERMWIRKWKVLSCVGLGIRIQSTE